MEQPRHRDAPPTINGSRAQAGSTGPSFQSERCCASAGSTDRVDCSERDARGIRLIRSPSANNCGKEGGGLRRRRRGGSCELSATQCLVVKKPTEAVSAPFTEVLKPTESRHHQKQCLATAFLRLRYPTVPETSSFVTEDPAFEKALIARTQQGTQRDRQPFEPSTYERLLTAETRAPVWRVGGGRLSRNPERTDVAPTLKPNSNFRAVLRRSPLLDRQAVRQAVGDARICNNQQGHKKRRSQDYSRAGACHN